MSAGEDAMWRIALRNTAPAFRELFTAFADNWAEEFFDLYLTFRYREGEDVADPEKTIMAIASIKSKKSQVVPYDTFKDIGGSEATLLFDMFPLFHGYIVEAAKEWNLNEYQVFLLIRYKKGIPEKDIMDSLELQLHSTKSTGKKLSKILD